MKKFYAVIGNPPYQEEFTDEGNKGYASPIYNRFMDAVEDASDRVELITPARFLFNAGSTPKAWNRKKLDDPHFKVQKYYDDASKVFPDTDIKGGVTISYRDANKDFGAIGTFIVDAEMRSVVKRVKGHSAHFLNECMYAPESYKFNDLLHADHPDVESELSRGHKYDLKSNVIGKLRGSVFLDDKPSDGLDYVYVVGVDKANRVMRWIRRNYLNVPSNCDKYKVLIPKAVGSGSFGERFPELIIAKPQWGHTQSFASIGAFATEAEANALAVYLKTKFVRALVSVLKVTQDLTSRVFSYVPLQDFTSNSDIDWSWSIPDIDKQLYVKYGLDDKEIAFIESHVKEMN